MVLQSARIIPCDCRRQKDSIACHCLWSLEGRGSVFMAWRPHINLKLQCGYSMAATMSIQPLTFDFLAGSTFDFCMKKSIDLATQPTCPTSEQRGLLVVGLGLQQDSCEAWLLNAIKSWETPSCNKTTSIPKSSSPCRVWTRIEGFFLSTVIKKIPLCRIT